MKLISLDKYLKQQIFRWSLLGLALSTVISIPALIYSEILSAERQISILAKSAVRSFRPQILSDNIRYVEFQLKNALDLKPGESAVIRGPDLKPIYQLDNHDFAPKCTKPKVACWSSGYGAVTMIYPIYFDENNNSLYGYLELTIHPSRDNTMLTALALLLTTAFVLQALGLSSVLTRSYGRITFILSKWANHLKTNPQARFIDSINLPFIELEALNEAIVGLNLEIDRLKEDAAKNAKLEGQIALARQVVHDIRSPLSALNFVVASVQNLPEDRRLLIRGVAQRINDIANKLLSQSKQMKSDRDQVPEDVIESVDSTSEPLMLVASLDSVVSEKRIQFRELMGIDIQADLIDGYGLFAKIHATEFARVISNLVNNSVEAISGEGWVKIGIRNSGTSINIAIADNGKGIPAEILARLGKSGVTYGKDGSQSGSGLGIYHARETLEKSGGQFSITSTLGQGTVVTLTLPKTSAPKWFIEKIEVPKGLTVVSLDDDQTVHQVWANRFQSGGAAANINHLMFTSLEQFQLWIDQNKSLTALYLVDYEFLGHADNGLNIIERTGINHNSILVTSRYEERSVRDHAESLGVKIVPKGLAPFVPILIG
jgi:signal transduction histidine kinase